MSDKEYLDVIPLGTMPKREVVSLRIMTDSLENLYYLYNKERSLESFDSFVNRLLNESIKRKQIKYYVTDIYELK